MLAVPLFAAVKTDTLFKEFGVSSGIINYEINGSKALTKESTMSIHGNTAMLFSDWGARRLYKEKYIESTTGAIKDAKLVRTLYRIDQGDLFSVNFEKNRIEKSEDLQMKQAIAAGENRYLKRVKNLKKEGKWLGFSKILGYQCDKWLYQGRELSLYKGVPLREELVISGIEVVKTAVSAKFDLNITEDAFAFPDLKKEEQKGFLLDKHKLASGDKKPEETAVMDFDSKGKAGNVVPESKSDKKKEIFHHQKELLPKLLDEMQEARICLESASYVDEANLCITKLLDIKKKMGGEKVKEEKITSWSDSAKEKTMDELEEGIMDMKRRMPCIRRSQKLEDLASCISNEQENTE